jgi:hypothetical protein
MGPASSLRIDRRTLEQMEAPVLKGHGQECIKVIKLIYTGGARRDQT